MFKTLVKDFIKHPVLEMDITEPTDEIELFGKKYRMYKDDWKKHIHLKCTNHCDARCSFCIENSSRYDSEDADKFIRSMKKLVRQMKDQGQFRTLSVTGGEPTMFPRFQEVVDFANKVKPMLFSVNSNGYHMNRINKGTFNGWLNLSKHAIHDKYIFYRGYNIGTEDMRKFKRDQPNGYLRLQSVLGIKGGLETLADIEVFVEHYATVADNFSFRSLIIESDHGKTPEIFTRFRNFLFDNGWIKSQSIQDYYVYEEYDWNGIDVTLSWSNMFLLKQYNETRRNNNFLEEIIVHPDGKITGSWNKKSLIIYNPNATSKCATCCWHNNGCRYERSGCGGGGC